LENKDRALFESMPVWRALMTLALPTIISQLVILVYNLADTFFIGQTGDPYKVAAASLVLPLYYMTIALSAITGTGAGTLISRLLGMKHDDEARKVSAYGFYLAIAIGTAYSLVFLLLMEPVLRIAGASDMTLEYSMQYSFFTIVLGAVPQVLSFTLSNFLRSVGCARQSSTGVVISCILNIILDPLFMFVLMPSGYEVMGAGIATFISSLVSVVYFIFIIRRMSGRTVLTICPNIGRPEKGSVSQIFSVGIPALLTSFLYDVCVIVIDSLSAAHGDVNMAAIGIVLKAERLPLEIGIGLCMGMIPLAAYNYAAGNFERMRETLRDTRIAGIAVALVCIVLYEIFAGDIMTLFISDAETVSLGTHYLQIRCLATVFMFMCFSFLLFFQAVGLGKTSLLQSVVRQLVFNIPLLFILNGLYGMEGIIWTQCIADGLTAAVAMVIYMIVEKKIICPKEKSMSEAAALR
jgi:multidrug efflux pump